MRLRTREIASTVIPKSRKQQTPSDNPGKPPEATHSGCIGSQNAVLLRAARVKLSNPNSESDGIVVRLIFDDGSQRSYLSQTAREKLNLETCGRAAMLINVFGQTAQQLETRDQVQFTVESLQDDFKITIDSYVVPEICRDRKYKKPDTTNPYLQNIQLADNGNENEDMVIDLLIGGDHIWKFLLSEEIRGEENGEGPVATNTRVGWVLSGPVKIESKHTLASVNFVATHVLKVDANPINSSLEQNVPVESFDLKDSVQRLWDIESIGIRDSEESVYDSFIENISFEEGRYTVQLPFKKHHQPLPDNYELSLVRLNSLYRWLQREPALLKEYNSIILDQIENNIVEKVDKMDIPEPGEVYFIPHQVVIRKQAASTRLRIVFDASSKVQPDLASLNDCLWTDSWSQLSSQ